MDFGFIIKKLLSIMIMPLSIVFLLFIIGIIFLHKNKIKTSKIFITATFLVLTLISYEPFSNILLKPLETKYSKLENIPKDVKYVLLLGGDLESRGLEALRLYHKIDGAKIITSGYEGGYDIPEAIRTANILYALGIPKEDVLVHPKPKDTKEEAIKIKKVLKEQAFILVTSAYHMPRAMAIFEKEGLHPIAAPTNFKVNKTDYLSFPGVDNLKDTTTAIHEYVGILWAKLRGQI